MRMVRVMTLGATLWMGCATFADRDPAPTFPQDLAAGCETTRACGALAARGRERVRVCEEEQLECPAARTEARRAEQLERAAAVREWTETRRREQALAAEERRREEAERAAQEEQAQRRERERAAQEEQDRRRKEADAQAQAKAQEELRRAADQPDPPPAPTPRPAPPRCTATVQCCDGTCSPSCTTVHRGCCSHHGGVCDG